MVRHGHRRHSLQAGVLRAGRRGPGREYGNRNVEEHPTVPDEELGLRQNRPPRRPFAGELAARRSTRHARPLIDGAGASVLRLPPRRAAPLPSTEYRAPTVPSP